MSTLAILTLKFGVSVGKAIHGLVCGEVKGVVDFGLEVVKDKGKEKAKALEAESKIESIQKRVLAEVAQSLLETQDESQLEAAATLAAVTFEQGFSYDSLFDFLDSPDRLPNAWRARRAPTPTGVERPIMADRADDDTLALHDRILRATARALIDKFEELPKFQAWFLRRVRREIQVGRRLGEALSAYIGDSRRRDLEFEAHYCDKLLTELDVVELFVDHPQIERQDKRQRLEIAYVKVQLASEEGEKGGETAVNAGELLEQFSTEVPRIVVLGKAGSGKSTLLRWYGLQAASAERDRADAIGDERTAWGQSQTEATPNASAWRDRVPFFVPLPSPFPDGDVRDSHLGAATGVGSADTQGGSWLSPYRWI